ncbi:MAG: hypothetical protein GY822_13025 [Deltaproteobacteria bacterium]|nr:hypothetical protein [Deltaproteobacteria bacterium]
MEHASLGAGESDYNNFNRGSIPQRRGDLQVLHRNFHLSTSEGAQKL